jgi:creatinine amidohydrolase/Fe(II)-dependent formamide hydrolase-like protein
MLAGLDTAILPLGATEQHGEALPFGTDTIIGAQVAADLADRLGALLLPALPFGVSIEHMSFPGTLTLSATTLVGVIRELCESLVCNGLNRVILLVSHLGNVAPAEIAAQEVVARTGAIVCVSAFFADMQDSAQQVLGLEPGQLDWAFFDSHGGAAEAAMVMAQADLVHMEAATAGSPVRPGIFYDSAMKYPQRVEEGSVTGQWGDPRRVSPGSGLVVDGEMGRRLIEACGKRLADRFHLVVEQVERGRAEAPSPAGPARWWDR